MRAGLILAALAATSFAAPHLRKRDLVVVYETETDIVWVTAMVTVTANPVEFVATATDAATTSTEVQAATGRFHHDVNPFPQWQRTSYAVVSSPTWTIRTPAPETTTVNLPPPAPTTTSTSTTSPDPVTSTTSVAKTTLVPVTTTSTPPPVPTTTTSSTTQAQTTTAAAAAKPTTYEQLVVAHHNVHRRNHSAPDIAWDTALANTAATIASSCKYAHNTDVDRSVIGGYGQNIAAGVGADNVSMIITELFYNGEVGWYESLYGQSQPDMSTFEHWGHFSQIVWRDTLKVGCATQKCDVLQGVSSNVPPYFTVCNYQSPGNVQGEYTEVGNSLHLPTAHWNYFA